MIDFLRQSVKSEPLYQLFLLTYIVCFGYKDAMGMKQINRLDISLGWWWPVKI